MCCDCFADQLFPCWIFTAHNKVVKSINVCLDEQETNGVRIISKASVTSGRKLGS